MVSKHPVKINASAKPKKRFPCVLCGTTFTRRSDHSRHVHIHFPEQLKRMRKCSHPGCSFTTLQLSNLKSHWNKHTGQKPYLCFVGSCEFSSGDPSSTIRHRFNIHKFNAADFKFYCDVCSIDPSPVWDSSLPGPLPERIVNTLYCGNELGSLGSESGSSPFSSGSPIVVKIEPIADEDISFEMPSPPGPIGINHSTGSPELPEQEFDDIFSGTPAPFPAAQPIMTPSSVDILAFCFPSLPHDTITSTYPVPLSASHWSNLVNADSKVYDTRSFQGSQSSTSSVQNWNGTPTSSRADYGISPMDEGASSDGSRTSTPSLQNWDTDLLASGSDHGNSSFDHLSISSPQVSLKDCDGGIAHSIPNRETTCLNSTVSPRPLFKQWNNTSSSAGPSYDNGCSHYSALCSSQHSKLVPPSRFDGSYELFDSHSQRHSGAIAEHPPLSKTSFLHSAPDQASEADQLGQYQTESFEPRHLGSDLIASEPMPTALYHSEFEYIPQMTEENFVKEYLRQIWM